jgi:hypothetical protein
MKRKDDFQLEQQIFLGGQVSAKHKQFKEMAKLSPDIAFIVQILKRYPEWEKMPDTEESTVQIAIECLELMGECEFLSNCSELTRLSMILGDTRGKVGMKRIIDELRNVRPDSTT